MPRNLKQVQNSRYNALHETRLSHDALFNIHDIAYDTQSYIHRITTYPDLEVMFGLRDILDHMDCIIGHDNSGQLLSYDTTFQLGDFYISTLVFRDTAFVERPCMSCILSIILLSVTIHIHNHDLASSVHTCIYIGGNRVNVQISLHKKTTKVGGDLPTNGAIGKTLNRDFTLMLRLHCYFNPHMCRQWKSSTTLQR